MKLKFFAAALVLFALMGSAQAQYSLEQDDTGPKVKAQVVAEKDGIKPGEKIRVALRQEITPGWHTYWRNPGDTGLQTTVEWQLPPGFTASELMFPTPHRQPIAGMMNFGYENEVFILAEITPPADLKIGDDVEIKGKASWLVCQEICIPENASFLITLPVVKEPSTSPWSSAFVAAAKKLPAAHQSAQSVSLTDDTIVISIDPMPLAADELPEEAYFFPHDAQLIQHNGEQKLDLNGRKATLTMPRSKTRTTPIETVAGDVWFRNAMGEKSFQFSTQAPVIKKIEAVAAAAPQNPQTPPLGPVETMGFFSAVIAAFLGGLLLNLMPCVFPVLSLKALSLVHKAHTEKRGDTIMGGVVYTLGVLATFSLLGLALVSLKGAGHNIGWGAQLQSPVFVAAMALLLFFIGFSLTGAVSLGARWIGLGQGLAHKPGLLGSFFTGALAVIVATPCTAPFMGGAVFYALTQAWFVTLGIMLAMGMGLAFPYLLLTLMPGALRFLPRPGIWMEYFKQFLAFPMFGAALWLVWVIAQQTGANGVLFVLCSMLSLAFGFWLWKTSDNRLQTWWQILKKIVAVLAVLFSFLLVSYQPAQSVMAPVATESDYFQSYSGEKLSALRSENKAVFVNMTAAWCITCLANEKAALATMKVRDYFKQNNITYLKGDWTNNDEKITQYLKEFGRSGVPLYVFYPAGQNAQPIVLPQILTPDTVISSLQQQPTNGVNQ